MNLKKTGCGCCTGVEKSTPAAIYNRPGLNSLQYRAGDYAKFLETMLARLSSLSLQDEQNIGSYPLQKLTTRSPDDFAIALLHGWATVADVLTFYQERLANEGFLRTATERRSVLELARLIGYQPRPGVSASVFLAYTLDDNFKEATLINKGARSQSIPGPDELPQAFETSDDLLARAAWNNLKPRLTRPQSQFSMLFDPKGPRVYLKGISTKLNADDPLLIDFYGNNQPDFYLVKEVIPDAAGNRTLVMLQTKITQLPPPFSLSAIYQYNENIDVLLLEKGDGLPGFFGIISSNDEVTELQLYSITNGSLWTLTIAYPPYESAVIYIILSQGEQQWVYEVKLMELIESENLLFSYVRITLQSIENYAEILKKIIQPPTLQPRSEARLSRELTMQFGVTATKLKATTLQYQNLDTSLLMAASQNTVSDKAFVTTGLTSVADASNAVAKRFSLALQEHLATATANAGITEKNPVRIYALRNTAAPFGYNAPLRQVSFDRTRGIYITAEWEIDNPFNTQADPPTSITGFHGADVQALITATEFHTPTKLYLDTDYQLLPNSWVVIDNPALDEKLITRFSNANIRHGALAAYGITGKTTLLSLSGDATWFATDSSFNVVRNTRIYIQSEELELAEEPLSAPVCGGSDDLIELDGYYENLQAGRWVIVSGERADIQGTSGLRFSELAMLSVVQQDVYRQSIYSLNYRNNEIQKTETTLLGDKTHSFIKLAKPLAYCFKRDTIKIYGNVVKATHGETRQEVLGSGNGAKTLQSFILKQPPLTFISAENPSGVGSTLKVRVNGVEWHESKSLNVLTPTSRSFISKTDDEGKTTVIFGNGYQGARLPTGVENIKAEYRNGIGKTGNVKAEQISLLVSRPLGVKEVINPLRASGGADKENRDQARKNAPLTTAALDRLVSVQDYQDFSRTYAGIGKAYAAELSDGRRQIVHVTIAGAEDVPIDESSDLFINLRKALHDYGDPFQQIQLAVRELMLLVISAKVKIHADYQWELVVAALRTALLDAFSFEHRELGQDVVLAEVISMMQKVAGVVYVDIEAFGGLPEKDEQRQSLTPAQIAKKVQDIAGQKTPVPRLSVNLAEIKNGIIRPAQIAFLTPEVPETLILNQIL